LIEFLPYLISISVSALIGIVSLFLYLETRKQGFALIGVGFLICMVPSLIYLALGGPYLAIKLRDLGLNTTEIGQYLFLLSLMDMAIYIVFAVLVLIGLVLFKRDLKTKQ